MGAAERRNAILRALCRRRHETISNLAFEFGVSERTIRRDIEILSLTEPIYTQTGRYAGGIYIVDNYNMDQMYMEEDELSVLKKVLGFAEYRQKCILTDKEISIFRGIVKNYSKPQTREKGLYV